MTAEWTPAFLAALSLTPNVTGACALAGVARSTAYDLRAADPAFAARWDDAIEQSVDRLVQSAWDRATGEDASDTLTIFLLKAHRRPVYGDTVKQEHSGPGGAPLGITVYLPDNGRDDPQTELEGAGNLPG